MKAQDSHYRDVTHLLSRWLFCKRANHVYQIALLAPTKKRQMKKSLFFRTHDFSGLVIVLKK